MSAAHIVGRNSSVARKVFLLTFCLALVASLVSAISASASQNIFKITNTSLVESSQNIQEDFEATDDANISQELIFHKVGDYAKYKISFKNSDSVEHEIESITDDNENEHVVIEYDDYSGTQVNAGGQFEFILTVKYVSAVDDLANRDQLSTIKLYIKYKEVDKPDEIDIDPSNPDTLDKLNISIIVLFISGIGLIILVIRSVKSPRKKTQIGVVILAVAATLFISANTLAITEGTDIVILSSEFGLYDKLAVTLEVNDSENTIAVDYDSTVSSIPNPEAPEGYDFNGWKDESGNQVDPGTKITNDTKLIADFKVKTYQITYSGLNDGEEQGLPTEYTIETSVTINVLPNRTDSDGDETQAFAGWKDDSGNTSETVTIPTGQTGNKNFEATWNDVPLPNYTASCDLDGGEGTESYTFNKKTETFTIEEPTKQYYIFKGWSGTDLDGEDNKNIQVAKGTRKNLEFKAHYTPEEYTLDYSGLNESELAGRPTSYTYESTIHLENPSDRFDSDGDKTHEFNGWSSSSITIDDPMNVSFDHEHGYKLFTVNWTIVPPTEYTVTYNYNGGSADNETEFTKYESIDVVNPKREYYTFTGWESEDITITNPMEVTIPVGTRKNVTLTATWTANEFDIDYEGLTDTEVDSLGLTKKYTVETGSISLTTPSNRTDEDESFIGWTSNDVDVSDPSNVSLTGKHSNITIKANWEANLHQITYELDGGSVDSNPTEFDKNSAPLTINNPTKNGYDFDGWTSSELGITTPSKNVTIPTGTKTNVTLTAHFAIVTYTISYSGTTADEEASLTKTYTINDTVTINPLANREDSDGDLMQTFLGWSDSSSSNPVSTISFSNETGNKSYEAKWRDEEYPPVRDITYDLNGGTVATNNPTSYTKQDSDFTLNNPSKTGYIFTGWSGSHLEGDNNTSVTIQTSWNEPLSYTAHYTPIQYTVEFNASFTGADSDDTTTMAAQTLTYGTEAELSDNTLDIKGYTFTGWKDENGTEYMNKASVTNLRDTEGVITLYAQWTPSNDTPYTIEFYFENANDDNFTKDDSKTIEGAGITNSTVTINPADHTFDHFEFTNNQSVTESTIDRHGSTVFKLYYKREKLTITFNANGGTITDTESETTTITKKYGATIAHSEFPGAEKIHSDLSGWYTAAEGGEEVSGGILVTAESTIFAQWDLVTLCQKATELHTEVCKNTSQGCKNNQYSVSGSAITGKRNTSTIVYGNISDGNSFETGDAFDCDINGDSVYDPETERFYYIRNNDGKAVLIFYSNWEGDHIGTSNYYHFDEALTKLPSAQNWSNLRDLDTYHDNRVARLLNSDDTQAILGGTGRSFTRPFDNDFILENTGYRLYAENVVRPAMWTEIAKGDAYLRIHSNSLEFNDKKGNESYNTVRPVIEVPMSLMDQSSVETVTITFDTRGGDDISPMVIGKGNAFRHGPIPVKADGVFRRWCLDVDCNEEVNYSTIFENDATIYADWEETSAVAKVGNVGYNSLKLAIENVPTTNEPTEVILLKDTAEPKITVNSGQNIILNLQDRTLTATNQNALELLSGSKVDFISGTIATTQSSGAINVTSGSEFIMREAEIKATGSNVKQALYINGGNATIYAGAKLSSSSTNRATVHLLCRTNITPACTTPGSLTILGGTIESSGAFAIYSEKGTLVIGDKDGDIATEDPLISGETYGVLAYDNFSFYDGTIRGKTYPVAKASARSDTPGKQADTNFDKIGDIEDYSLKYSGTDGDYKTLYLDIE